jgi:transglutaminase-like putative cysteine protease
MSAIEYAECLLAGGFVKGAKEVARSLGRWSAQGSEPQLARETRSRLLTKTWEIRFSYSPEIFLDQGIRDLVKMRGAYRSPIGSAPSSEAQVSIEGPTTTSESEDSAGDSVLLVYPRAPDGRVVVVQQVVQKPLAFNRTHVNAIAPVRGTPLTDGAGKQGMDGAQHQNDPDFRGRSLSPRKASPRPFRVFRSTLMMKNGYCWERSHLLVAIMRAHGIEARQRLILNQVRESGTMAGWHLDAEIKTPDLLGSRQPASGAIPAVPDLIVRSSGFHPGIIWISPGSIELRPRAVATASI